MGEAAAQIEKVFLSAGDLLSDSFALARMMIEDGVVPDVIVGVWRGGTPVGIAVQEAYEFCGLSCDHISIRTASYTGINQQESVVRVLGIDYLIDNLNADDALLIVDDVFDSGRSIDAIITTLQQRCRRNMPADVRVGTVYFKPSKNRTARVPDYFVRETEEWLVFPHELDGLSDAEIRQHKPQAAALLAMRDAAARRRKSSAA